MLIVLRIYEIRFACVADFSHALLDSSKDQSGFDIPVNNFLAILRQLDGRSTHHAHQSQNMTCLSFAFVPTSLQSLHRTIQ